MELSPKDLSSPSDLSSSYRKSSTCMLAQRLFFLYCLQIIFSHLTSLLKIILLVSMFRNLYTSFVWPSAYPTNIHVFLCHPTWISSSCLHVRQSLQILQMFSNFFCTLHLPHRTMYEGFCSFWLYHYVVQLCCCGNYFTPEVSFIL